MAESVDESADTMALPVRKKQPKQQLTKGMEHMRSYVTISDQNSAPTSNGDIGEDAYGVPASYEPIRKPNDETATTNTQKRSDPFQFGTRYLTNDDNIFAFNAWDHVEVDPQYSSFITEQTAFQREHQVSDFDKHRFNSAPEKWWDKFYSNNSTNFFKDRKWLVQEFPVLGEVTKAGYGECTLFEVGAGAGNTAFPLLAMNENQELKLWACDYSTKAIDLIRSQPAYTNQSEPAVLRAEVWDAASTSLPPGLEPGSVDLVLMIFIFSALSPEQWEQAVKNVWTLLKPGGEVLFRDYGRGDLAQVRFKKGRYLEENFYVRGDGTRVYFFEQEELRGIWNGEFGPDAAQAIPASREGQQVQAVSPADVGGSDIDTPVDADDQRAGAAFSPSMTGLRDESRLNGDVSLGSFFPEDAKQPEPGAQIDEAAGLGTHTPCGRSGTSFEVVDLATDRRMLVNRQRKLKMYRCWLQGRFRKPKAGTGEVESPP